MATAPLCGSELLAAMADKDLTRVHRVLDGNAAALMGGIGPYAALPLHIAASSGFPSAMPLALALAEGSGGVEARDAVGATALMYAAVSGQCDAAAFLLRRCGAVVDAEDRRGATALHYAGMYGHGNIVREILRRSAAAATFTDNDGCSPAHYAAYGGHFSVFLELCAAADVPVSPVARNGRTALHAAADSGNVALVAHCVSCGCCVMARDVNEWTPVHGAAVAGHTAVVRYFFEECLSDPSSRQGASDIAMYWASAAEHAELVQYLTKVRNTRRNKNKGSASLKAAKEKEEAGGEEAKAGEEEGENIDPEEDDGHYVAHLMTTERSEMAVHPDEVREEKEERE